MPNIPVPQIVLNQSRVNAVIRQSITTAVPEHMRMDSNNQPGIPSGFSQQVIKSLTGKRTP